MELADETAGRDRGMRLRGFGTIFKSWPTVEEIAARLPIAQDEAEWIYNACDIHDKTHRMIVLNDVANAVALGVRLEPVMMNRILQSIIDPPLWEREKS